MDLSRRKFLKGTATGAAGTALAGGVLIGGAHADANAATLSGPAEATSYPFHGANQSGVLTPGPSGKQAFTCVAAFDSMAADQGGPGRPAPDDHHAGRGSSPPAASRPTSASASRRPTATSSARSCPPTGSP